MRKHMKPLELINFSQLNKYYNLSKDSIRKDKIPNKYKKDIEKLELVIKIWMEIP